MLDTLDAAAVRRWCASGLAALQRHQGEIDDLNVYPVPDGDTGTNLVLTLTSAQQALAMDLDTLPEDGHTPHGHALRLMARGALLGARGNSGVILSQILRGFADALAAARATVRRSSLSACSAARAAEP
ncbi:DAK2 domain-containing protein, partial [Micromonospora globispora]|uniref:DAK2 domain-containing protein n=1 Tax=Micromonospora globispora TaxID=1450148 RepID=UPI0021AB422B